MKQELETSVEALIACFDDLTISLLDESKKKTGGLAAVAALMVFFFTPSLSVKQNCSIVSVRAQSEFG